MYLLPLAFALRKKEAGLVVTFQDKRELADCLLQNVGPTVVQQALALVQSNCISMSSMRCRSGD